MAQPQLQELLDAGVHFGHQTRRWNPKMRRFIFAERNGIYIIDLQKTLRQIELAQELLASVDPQGRQRALRLHQEAAQGRSCRPRRSDAARSSSPSAGSAACSPTSRPSRSRSAACKDLEQGAQEGEFENYTKKEQLLFEREREKLNTQPLGHQEHEPPARRCCSWSTPRRRRSRSPRRTSWASRSSRSWTPTPTRT